MAELVLVVDGIDVKRYPVQEGRLLIGRAVMSDIVIEDRTVSGRHAEVETLSLGDGGAMHFISDLDSTNGTWVGDVRIRRARLRDEDLIRIGFNVFRFDHGGQRARPPSHKTSLEEH